MSIHVMSWLWRTSPRKGSELLLMLAMADVADDDGSKCFLGRESLAAKIRMHERTVIRLCNKLVAEGDLIYEGRSYRGTNEYRIAGVPAKGDKLSSPREAEKPRRGDIPLTRGDKSAQGGDKSGRGGDIAASPNSSLDTSLDSSSKPPRARDDFEAIKVQVAANLRIAEDPTAYAPARKAARKLLLTWGIPVDDGEPIEEAPPSSTGERVAA